MSDHTIKLSATRLDVFMSCKYKYWLNYGKHIIQPTNDSFKLGTLCHNVLEFTGKIWMSKGYLDDNDKNSIIEYYNKLSDMSSYQVHLYGLDLITAKINDFDMGGNVIGLEIKFGTDDSPDVMSDLGVPLIGAIDKVVRYNDDTLIIVDYKTSKSMPTNDQMDHNMQLSLYDIVARKMWPGYKRYILCLDMLKNKPIFNYRNSDDRLKFELFISEKYKQMLNFSENEAVPTINEFCAYCNYRDMCDKYNEFLNRGSYVFEDLNSYSDTELYDEWDRLKNTVSILNGRLSEVSTVISEKIATSNKRIHNKSKELYLRQNARTTYDVEKIGKELPLKDLLKITTFNTNRLTTYAEKRPNIKELIDSSAVTTYTAPFLAKKNFKE